jgi:hypothetical protein
MCANTQIASRAHVIVRYWDTSLPDLRPNTVDNRGVLHDVEGMARTTMRCVQVKPVSQQGIRVVHPILELPVG